MDVRELQVLGDAVADHWYYRSKARALQRELADTNYQRLLDVGAGSGFFSRWLLERSAIGEALCVDTGYREGKVEHVGDKPLAFAPATGPVDADLVLMMDVLEHVDDDGQLLRQYLHKVPAGSTFVITVPAFQFLWSSHDVFLEHRRRYTAASLARTVRDAGLEIERLHYFFALLFPLALVSRLADRLLRREGQETRSQLRRHSRLGNAILAALCRLELPVMKFNRLGGLSVFCRCRKP